MWGEWGGGGDGVIEGDQGESLIPELGEVPMEAAILAHVHPLGPSFRPGGGQALLLPTVNLLTLNSLLQIGGGGGGGGHL